MTRNGKIARLPYGIREILNRSLRDGKSGAALLKWLNEQEACLEVLDEEFESRPITKQNLSEWKQGGYKEWLRHEESRQRVQVLMEKAVGLEEGAGGMAIADRLGTLLAAELAVAMEQLDEIKDPKERWARVKDIARELYRLRREDHHARKLRMAEEQYQRREKEAGRERLLDLQEAMQNKQLVASVRGGGDEARKWSDWTIRVKHGLPMPLWWTNPQSAEDWFELMTPYWWEEVATLKGAAQASPKSKAQSPKASKCGLRIAHCEIEKGGRGSANASRSKSDAVRPGPTGAGQKSGAVQPGPDKSKSLGKAESRNEKAEVEAPSSIRLRKATTRQEEAPNSKIQEHGAGETGGLGKTGAVSSNGAEPVKASPTELKNDSPSSDRGATRDEGERGSSDPGAQGNEGGSGGNAT